MSRRPRAERCRSLTEALETGQVEVLGRVERLREQIAGPSEELPGAEGRLSWLRITRKTAEEVLAMPSSPVPGTDGSGVDGVGGNAGGEVVADVTVVAPEYRAITGLSVTSGAASGRPRRFWLSRGPAAPGSRRPAGWRCRVGGWRRGLWR